MIRGADFELDYGVPATIDGVYHVNLFDVDLKLLEMELRMCPDLTPDEKFRIYLDRRSCVTLQEMLQTIGLYTSDL